MKKFLAITLVITLALSMVALFAGCGNKDEATTTAAANAETEPETTEATTEATTEEELPKAGDVLTFGSAKLTIPEGWVVDKYEEGKMVDLNPADDTFPTITVDLHQVYDDNHAKEWADNIDENYGGGHEIDQVKIGGVSFYRVKAESEQNICFADLDDSTYLEVAVMFMPWEDGEAVLNNIVIG